MAEETTTEQDQEAPKDGKAAEFRPIESQDDLNRIIGERLDRERAKFSDYDDLKAKASRLDEIEDANKTEIEKARERVSAVEDELGTMPAKVADALRTHLVGLHQISDDDADLFLTASDPETLLRQVDRLVARSEPKPRAPRPNAAQTSGDTTPQGDWLRQHLART